MTGPSDSNARPEPPPAAAPESLADRRRRSAQRRRLRRIATTAAAAVVAIAGAGWATLSSGRLPAPSAPTGVRSVRSSPPPRVEQRQLEALSAPLSVAAGAVVGGKLVLAGGLTVATASVANVYAHAGSGQLSPALSSVPPRVYVPESGSNTVAVIDPATYTVIDRFAVGAQPQHITPSYDLKTLYVLNNQSNSVTPLDPLTGQPRSPLPVTDPYNLYFTPGGRYSIVVAEAKARLDFRDPHTFHRQRSLPVPCRGIDHLDFTADGRFLLASCEFSGQLVVVDVRRQTVIKTLALGRGTAMPQDVKLAPDGRVFYVADMRRGGLWIVTADTFRVSGFLPTGKGAHGLYPSRDARVLYVSNRGEGTVSVVDFAARRIVATWLIPGGSPDMGGVSANGRVLWLTGRYNGEVYAVDTRTGHLLARISVGRGPHGLAVWPQPGRYSLGHTGLMR